MLILVILVKHSRGVCWTMVSMHDCEVNLAEINKLWRLFCIVSGIRYEMFYIGCSMN